MMDCSFVSNHYYTHHFVSLVGDTSVSDVTPNSDYIFRFVSFASSADLSLSSNHFLYIIDKCLSNYKIVIGF